MRPEAHAGHLGGEIRPELAGAQRQVQFGAARPAADPDQPEVPHARAAGVRLTFQVDHVEAAPARRDGVHGAEHPAADHDHPARA